MTERLRVRIPAGVAEEFSSLESTLCADSFGVRFTPVLPQGHLKDPDHYAKSAGGRLHLNTHTLLTRRSRSGLTVPLSEPIQKRAHTQLVREHSATVVTAR